MPAPAGAVPAGTVITNTARADFTVDTTPQTVSSNPVTVTTVLLGTPSSLELFRYAPASPAFSMTVAVTGYFDGGGFTPAPVPTDPSTAASIDLAVPVPLEPEANFSLDDPVFIRLFDPDGNGDPAVADTLSVTVRDNASSTIEILLLTETGADTGVFSGYVASGGSAETPFDGVLYGYPGSSFSIEYTDPADPSDSSTALFTFDAAGVLWITAESGKSTVSAGDYLTYTVTVQNTSGSTVPATVLTTDLPLGFRYEAGSTSLGGTASPDPLVAPDGRSLAFSVGDLLPGTAVRIVFVVRVGSGTPPGRAVSPSLATSGALVSNTALASVRIIEDLFRSRNTIMGRVLGGACGDGATGVAGVKIFLEDGTFVITDEKGRYHFEGVRPGTHVLQLDLETVPGGMEAVACDSDTRQAGRPWSRFVDLSGGALWRVDFNLAAPTPAEGKALLILRTVTEAEKVYFKATMQGEQVALGKVRFRVTLPDGVEYEPGTARLEGQPVGDPVMEGRVLTWDLGDMAGIREQGIAFETRILEGWDWTRDASLEPLGKTDTFEPVKNVQGRMAEVVSSASISFETPTGDRKSTPDVANVLMRATEKEETRTRKFVFRPHFGTFESGLTDDDRKALDIIASQFDPAEIDRIQVTGHTDDVPISANGRRLYADNYELSDARARSVAYYLRDVWDLPSGMFTTEGRGPDMPVASNDTARGRTLNRRVEVNVITTNVIFRTELEPLSEQHVAEVRVGGLGTSFAQAAGVDPGVPEEDQTVSQSDPLEDLAWFEEADGTPGWILPEEGLTPGIPAIKVAVKHAPGSRVSLTVNGREADPLSFEGTTSNDGKTSSLSVWRGVRLQEGDNRLVAAVTARDGMRNGTIERIVYYAGRPVTAEVVPELSRLVADGTTPPLVALRMTDEQGRAARPGLVGQFTVDPPYRTAAEKGVGKKDAVRAGIQTGPFVIGRDGMALLTLEPTTRSGEARLKVAMQGEEREVSVWLTANRQEWIVVGLAEGTVGYNTVSGNMESLEESGGEEDLYTDGRVALFAKGRIKGEYLLTMAYDSDGPHGAAGEGHHGTIDPDTYYTLYGDGAEQDYEAPTSEKLYLKIEKGQFYALFGDTSTGLTVTELSRYDRRITGFRSEKRSEGYSWNLFASETEQGFVRDEIPGDGTSGLYRLSTSDVVANSESVRIEVRDRFESHVVLSTETLTRHTDYSIDYGDGTLFFREPVLERDAGFNPVFIVAEYETSDPAAAGMTYGGRGEARLGETGITTGVSHVHEDRGEDEGEVTGIDLSADLAGGITLRAEAARSSNETGGITGDASAYLLEASGVFDRLEGSVYLRETESGFGLGHQSVSQGGTRKAGAEALYHLTGAVDLTAELLTEENLVTGADREVQEVGAAMTTGNTVLNASVRQATDTDAAGTELRSSQVTAGARWLSGDRRLELRADHEQSLGDNENTDYPTRTVLGTDYRITDKVSLFLEQEYTDGEETSVSATRAGMKATPWEGGAASSSVERSFDENGERVYATSGLTQTWDVNDRWSVSAGVEGARVIREPAAVPVNPEAPPVTSEEDYTAVSLGAGYTLPSWEFDLRLEGRDAESSDKWGVIGGAFGEPADGVGVSADLKHFRTESDAGVRTTESDVRLGFVYRPWDRRWTFLNRLEYTVDNRSGAGTDTESWKAVDNFNANYRPDDDLQLSLKVGIKYVRETVEGLDYSGLTHLLGIEGRYDLSPRWDVGGWSSVLTALDSGTTDYGLGASAGYSLMENLWLSMGYNIRGFEDADFSPGDFTAQGPFVKFRLKFDQEDLKNYLR